MEVNKTTIKIRGTREIVSVKNMNDFIQVKGSNSVEYNISSTFTS